MKQGILALVLLTLSSFSLSSDASECSTGGCTNGDSNLSGSQSQNTYNDLTQAPTMSMSGSNSNSIVNANSVSTGGVSMSADGGININGTCATNTFVVSVHGGMNQQEVARSSYRSNAENVGAVVSYVMPTGEAQDLCIEGQRVRTRVAKIAESKMLLNTCFEFMRKGIPLNSLAEILPEFAICPKIGAEAEKNYHGQIGRAAIDAYKKQMVAQGVDPYQTFAK